jgi:hypothetical protein
VSARDFVVGLGVVTLSLTVVIILVALLFPSRGGSD